MAGKRSPARSLSRRHAHKRGTGDERGIAGMGRGVDDVDQDGLGGAGGPGPLLLRSGQANGHKRSHWPWCFGASGECPQCSHWPWGASRGCHPGVEKGFARADAQGAKAGRREVAKTGSRRDAEARRIMHCPAAGPFRPDRPVANRSKERSALNQLSASLRLCVSARIDLPFLTSRGHAHWPWGGCETAGGARLRPRRRQGICGR